jgi:DNA-binding GntR family transcriptional regulator
MFVAISSNYYDYGLTLATPAYQTVADELRQQITAGAYPPDRRLPTEAELSATFRVSRQTVRHAFAELVAEGLVYRVAGRGSFALGSPTGRKYLRSLGSVEDLMALAVDTAMEVLEPLQRRVDVAAASRLRLDTDEVAVGLFRRLNRDEPFSITRSYLPPRLAERIVDDARIAAGATSNSTIIGLLEELDDVRLAGAHQSVSAAIADAETAVLIGCKLGDPVLMIDRIYFDRAGAFVELAISTFNVHRYSYRLELRRSAVR